MPIKDCINVQLVVDGKPLREYYDLESIRDGAVAQQSFVEIKAGQQFEVLVTLMAGFKLQFASYFHWLVVIDNLESTQYGIVTDCRGLPHKRGAILHDEATCFDSMIERDQVNGQWLERPFVFGALGITDKPPEKEIVPSQFENLGSIRVTCFRATKVLLDVPYVHKGEPVTVLDELPESVLKGRDIKNNVKFGPGRRAHGVQPLEYDTYLPVDGKRGEAYNFQITYRTRKTLQKMGLIPCSPSPPPDKDLIIQRQEQMLREQKRQITKLQVKNAQDHQQSVSTIKKEANILTTGDTVNAPRGIKRERDENDDDELTEIAPPAQKPRVLIDLTEDDDCAMADVVQ